MRFSGRVVVVSPHLDDAILSLGTTIARAVREGARVEVLTVFALGPNSTAPADDWDFKSGFDTEGAASISRREEDRRACRELGARPRWLDFGASPYERHGSEEQIWRAVESVTGGADTVFLPGYPLAHRDHAELTQLLLRRGLGCRHILLYAEQPYLYYHRKSSPDPATAAALRPLLNGPLAWTRMAADRSLRLMKQRAVSAYRSQRRQLGLGFFGLRHMLWHESVRGGEVIAALPAELTAHRAA